MNHWHEKHHVLYIMHLVSYCSYLTLSHKLQEEKKNIFLLIMNGGMKGERGRCCAPAPQIEVQKA
jgi:hypothetical protein